LLAAALAAACGCAQHTEPVVPEPPKTPAERRFEAVWQASIQTLREHRFVVDRQDRRAGVVTTYPMVGQHWFEFWRQDAASAADLAESTLQTIYRRATVTIRRREPDDPNNPPRYRPVVEVTTARSNRPQPQVSSTSEAYAIFSLSGGRSAFVMDLGGGEEEASASGNGVSRPEGTVPLGRDEHLEARLAGRIGAVARRRLAEPPAAER
jgi:hypothetical protein